MTMKLDRVITKVFEQCLILKEIQRCLLSRYSLLPVLELSKFVGGIATSPCSRRRVRGFNLTNCHLAMLGYLRTFDFGIRFEPASPSTGLQKSRIKNIWNSESAVGKLNAHTVSPRRTYNLPDFHFGISWNLHNNIPLRLLLYRRGRSEPGKTFSQEISPISIQRLLGWN